MLGAWCLVLGAWCLVLGAWCLVLGAWCRTVRYGLSDSPCNQPPSHWGMQLLPFFPHHSEARQQPRTPPSSSPVSTRDVRRKAPFGLFSRCVISAKKISSLARVVNCITSRSSPSPLLSLFFCRSQASSESRSLGLLLLRHTLVIVNST